MLRVSPVGLIVLATATALAAPGQRKLPAPTPLSLPGPPTLQVGSLTLTRCDAAYCGVLPRPLDPSGEVPGSISIHFAFYPQKDPAQPTVGALVATEGGPGYATTGSRAYYLGLFDPLREQRSLLLMDNRGTGDSNALACYPLQFQSALSQSAIQSCGAQLGTSSDLYGSSLAADDLAAIIEALGLPPVDLYGDSYGTFFSQAFAGRHPTLLRSVVLDSAYAVIGADPWYPEAPPAARNAFNVACQRSVTCQNLPGVSMDRIYALLTSIREHPVSGFALNGDGTPSLVTANPQGLAFVMFSNASGPVVYRELDAAARAWLERNDRQPFLRLIAENQEVSHPISDSSDVSAFSAALFTAVSCTDYTQIYPMTSPLEQRAIQGAAAIRQKQAIDPAVFAPFTIDEFLQMPLDYSVVNLCLRWPVPSPAHPPGQPVPPGTVFPAVPVLVLSGDLDSLTPAAQGAQAAALFPNARQVIVANSFHVTALADPYRCASQIVRHFVETLTTGDTSCAARIPEVHLLPSFALHAADLDPATALAGNAASPRNLRIAAAAAFTFGDAMARFWVNYDQSGAGLRGGAFTYRITGSQIRFTLDSMQWTEDVTASGTGVWDLLTGAVQANLIVGGIAGAAGALQLTYSTTVPGAMATLQGTLGGQALAATLYAP